MARNGSGVYALPTGQPVVTGTTISSTTHNTLMSDIASALTTSIASDGQTAMGANLPMGGNKLTGLGAATVAGDALRYEQFTPLLRAALLGTVSQSAGVPTGSVIERGFNANGEYVKFADGTLICNVLLSGQSVSAGGITGITWTFPATFAANPCVFFSPGAPNASEDVYGVARTYTINTTSATFGYRNGATAQTINNIAACAIARWF